MFLHNACFWLARIAGKCCAAASEYRFASFLHAHLARIASFDCVSCQFWVMRSSHLTNRTWSKCLNRCWAVTVHVQSCTFAYWCCWAVSAQPIHLPNGFIDVTLSRCPVRLIFTDRNTSGNISSMSDFATVCKASRSEFMSKQITCHAAAKRNTDTEIPTREWTFATCQSSLRRASEMPNMCFSVVFAMCHWLVHAYS
jgi:hypothetical protein